MQIIYPVQGGSIKLSRVFVGECGVEDAVEDAVIEAAENDPDLTQRGQFDIIPAQNVCSPATGKEDRI